MGKHVSLPPAPSGAEPETTDVEGVDAILDEQIERQRKLIDYVDDVMAKSELAPQVIRERNGAVAKLTGLLAEKRQRSKFKQATLTKLTIGLVLDRIRQCTADERAYVLDEIEAMGQPSNVLG